MGGRSGYRSTNEEVSFFCFVTAPYFERSIPRLEAAGFSFDCKNVCVCEIISLQIRLSQVMRALSTERERESEAQDRCCAEDF